MLSPRKTKTQEDVDTAMSMLGRLVSNPMGNGALQYGTLLPDAM